ncbi:unnamed protein product [Taenia asiatica]|uniref:Uncharacterized protein n=1 Tax=Taenia asiatica TaxID=60517 RepID=A0A0R3W8E5_TAEAS|nr:unnamed protein product [Taenia asiatica]
MDTRDDERLSQASDTVSTRRETPDSVELPGKVSKAMANALATTLQIGQSQGSQRHGQNKLTQPRASGICYRPFPIDNWIHVPVSLSLSYSDVQFNLQ